MACRTVMVSRETTKRANDLRKGMLQEAIKMASGRSCQEDFDSAWLSYNMCYDPYQPAEDLSAFAKSRLRNFYPVGVSEEDNVVSVTYRHKILPKRKRVSTPSLSGRCPSGFGLQDVSGRDPLVDVTKLTYISGITKGPHHLTIEWMPLPEPPEVK